MLWGAALATLSGLTSSCVSVPLPDREGIALYRAKCGSCHRPYAPSEIRLDRWEKTREVMEARAKLTADERGVIRRYLDIDLVPSHVGR